MTSSIRKLVLAAVAAASLTAGVTASTTPAAAWWHGPGWGYHHWHYGWGPGFVGYYHVRHCWIRFTYWGPRRICTW
ncbi:hypothetical protein [Methylovirgula sp. 4M-Z18]|uniref:hypothetical protein n=1 Tax=Methylovirgula sp. 4M-Z18 TaxID=2293567 RepID=UPI000E2FC168|nr:hypothetical protein [Methylovirgula sp. 4M-Z18]RFB79658.1 hypothetical protein DYH55_09230 [Methylovirgula sp. 4M-Z18]